jgi:hypothetical protein
MALDIIADMRTLADDKEYWDDFDWLAGEAGKTTSKVTSPD